MKNGFGRNAAFASLLLLGGCKGLLFTEITEPLVTNLKTTPIGTRNGHSDLKSFHYGYVDVRWDSNAIGDAAKAHGITNIYYADLHTISVLGGLWSQQEIEVYGD